MKLHRRMHLAAGCCHCFSPENAWKWIWLCCGVVPACSKASAAQSPTFSVAVAAEKEHCGDAGFQRVTQSRLLCDMLVPALCKASRTVLWGSAVNEMIPRRSRWVALPDNEALRPGVTQPWARTVIVCVHFCWRLVQSVLGTDRDG